MYIVPPTISGADSCPRSTPVEKVHAGASDAAFDVLISESPLYRELAKSFAGRTHCPSSAAVAPAGIVAPVPLVTVLEGADTGNGLPCRSAPRLALPESREHPLEMSTAETSAPTQRLRPEVPTTEIDTSPFP